MTYTIHIFDASCVVAGRCFYYLNILTMHCCAMRLMYKHMQTMYRMILSHSRTLHFVAVHGWEQASRGICLLFHFYRPSAVREGLLCSL